VNNRPVRDAAASHAAALAAREVLRNERHPGFALFLTCDGGTCDVNVHPQKTEVRFRDSSAVHSLVYWPLVTSLTAGKDAESLSRAARPGAPYRSVATAPLPPNAAKIAEALGAFGKTAAAVSQVLVPEAFLAPSLSSGAYPSPTASPSPVGPLRLLGQLDRTYLVAESEDGLVLVDQHVAHERVRFERIQRSLRSERPASQALLVPVRFEATVEEAETLRQREGDLAEAGFLVSELSGRSFVVSAVPEGTPEAAVPALLRDLVEPGGPDRRDRVAASLACRGAVMAGAVLRPDEAARLLADLEACDDPWTCPHGRPVLARLGRADIERLFKRR
jgi:DNA mismatch repair protein MutL